MLIFFFLLVVMLDHSLTSKSFAEVPFFPWVPLDWDEVSPLRFFFVPGSSKCILIIALSTLSLPSPITCFCLGSLGNTRQMCVFDFWCVSNGRTPGRFSPQDLFRNSAHGLGDFTTRSDTKVP